MTASMSSLVNAGFPASTSASSLAPAGSGTGAAKVGGGRSPMQLQQQGQRSPFGPSSGVGGNMTIPPHHSYLTVPRSLRF